jgi:TRAP-type C4-dicarboxylate transport system permease small subunit
MGGKIDRFFLYVGKLNHMLRWVGVGCLLFLCALVVKEVVMRCVFNAPSGVTVELARTIQIYLGFLCAGYVQSIKAHLNMESLLDYVKPRTKKVTLILGALLGVAYCGFMAYGCWNMFIRAIRTHEVTLMLEWPMYLVKTPTFIGFTLLGLQFLKDAWVYFRTDADSEHSLDLYTQKD